MSAGAYPPYPDELKASMWEKDKKSGFDAKSDVAGKLKALQKRHDAVDWKLFAEGWVQAAKSAVDLEAEGGKRRKLFSSSALPLKKEALAVVAVVKAAEKKAEKDLLATLKAIGKAADSYADAVDQCGDTLEQAIEKAEDQLPAEEDEDSSPSALVDPKLLSRQLTLCRKDPERKVGFAYVDGKDKQPAMMAVHARMSARKLFAKLQAAAGVKTGAYGMAWVDDKTLMLQPDKPQSGLVKKIRAPVKACGFRIAKAVIWNEDGTLFEQDEQPDEAGEGGAAEVAATAATATAPPAPPPPSATYETKLAALTPRVKEAADAGSADAARHRQLLDFAAGKAKGADFLGAVTVLRQVEQLLDKPTVQSRPDGHVDGGVAFKARLSAAMPGIQAAIKAGGDNAVAIRLKFSQMGVFAKKPDYPGAQTVLDEIDELMVVQRATKTIDTEAPTDAKAAEVDALRTRLQDDYDALSREPLPPALRERFQPIATAWTIAQDATRKNLHDRALLILTKIADSGSLAKLRQALSTGADAKQASGDRAKAPPTLADLQNARLVWDGMRKSVQSQFSSIQSAVMTSVRAHNDDPEIEDEFDEDEIAAKLEALFVSLDTMDQGLIDKLDEALNAEGSQRDARQAEAAVLVQQFRDFAASDPTLAFIDDNGFASTQIRADVDRALAELSAQI